MKLSDWAKEQGIAYLTAYRWFKAGKLPVKAYQTESGTIIVKEENDQNTAIKKINDNFKSFNEDEIEFIKKTIEFSQKNCSLSDFAVFILKNFEIISKGKNKNNNDEHFKSIFYNLVPKNLENLVKLFEDRKEEVSNLTEDQLKEVNRIKKEIENLFDNYKSNIYDEEEI